MNAFSPDDQEGPERAGGDGAVGLLDPVEELAEWRPVLVDDDVFADLVPQYPPEDQELFDQLAKLADALAELTAWSRDELLDQIGCEHRERKNLVDDPATLDRCTRFLLLLTEAATLVEGVGDCRTVVRSCARLSKVTRDVGALRGVLERGDLSPFGYLAIGEIATAIRTARVELGLEPAAVDVGPSPYDGLPPVHLSPPRAELYARGERALLGDRVYDAIARHVARCDACREAVEFQQTRLPAHH